MNATAEVEEGVRVYAGTLHIVRGRRVELRDEPPREKGPVARPLRAARMLALAHRMQALLEDRVVGSQAELAELMGVTRARVTQLLDLTLLAPDIAEVVLFAVNESGRDAVTERGLRAVVRRACWAEQRRAWRGRAS